jgi:transcriptional regulator with XRE-family HTH domain
MSIKTPDPIDVEVGQRIQIYRKAMGMSQAALAEQIGVTFQQLQKYEKGVNRIGAGRLGKIARALQVPIAALLGADDALGGRGKGEAEWWPLRLMNHPGAFKLLHAFARLADGKIRRSIIRVVEGIAAGRHGL